MALLQQVVGGLVFGDGLVEMVLALVEIAYVGVAEPHAHGAVCFLVFLKRSLVVHQCRIRLPGSLVDGSEVGQVDGLSEFAAQPRLGGQRHAEDAVGQFVVAQLQIDVAQSVERDGVVFAGLVARLVGILHAEVQRAVVFFRCHVEHAHAAVVGGQVVQTAHQLGRVARLLGCLHALAVVLDGYVEEAVVAVVAAQGSVAHGHAQQVLGLFVGRQHGLQTVGIAVAVHDAVNVQRLALASGCLCLAVAGCQRRNQGEDNGNCALGHGQCMLHI